MEWTYYRIGILFTIKLFTIFHLMFIIFDIAYFLSSLFSVQHYDPFNLYNFYIISARLYFPIQHYVPFSI